MERIFEVGHGFRQRPVESILVDAVVHRPNLDRLVGGSTVWGQRNVEGRLGGNLRPSEEDHPALVEVDLHAVADLEVRNGRRHQGSNSLQVDPSGAHVGRNTTLRIAGKPSQGGKS
jgi:hypothetical protein